MSPPAATNTLVILIGEAAQAAQQAVVRAQIQSSADLQVAAEKPLTLVLPEDDALLRQLLAHEIETIGEVDTLVQWAPKLVSSALHCLVVKQSAGPSALTEILKEHDSYVSPNEAVAAAQIAVLFPGTDTRKVTPKKAAAPVSAVKPPPTPTSAPTSTTAGAGTTPFRARPAPSTKPTIQPRLSRAAALRMGVAYQPPSSPLRSSSLSPSKGAPVGISGLPRSDVKIPASLRAPTIAPRLNKVAAARTGVPTERAASPKKPVDYSQTPGHKRASSVSAPVTSTAAPQIVPRQNRASMSRINNISNGAAGATRPASSAAVVRPLTSVGSAPAVRKQVDYAETPGHKRQSLSVNRIAALQAPAVLPRQNRASLARAGAGASGGDKENTAPRPPSSAGVKGAKPDFSNVPGHKRQSLNFSLASLKTPLIQPRLNKAADARIGAGAAPGSATPTSAASSPTGTHKVLGPISRRAPPPSSFRASRV